MRYKSVLMIIIGTLFVLSSGFATTPAPGGAPGGRTYESVPMGWVLSKATVIRPAQISRVKAGTLVREYVLECKASAVNKETPIQSGTFRVTLNVFSPSSNMPGQKAGSWYIRGPWVVMSASASAQEKKGRHSPAVMSGTVSAELGFNPAAAKGALDAQILLPGSPNGGFLWSRGGGTFSGNEKFEGVFKLSVLVLPDKKGVRK